MNITSHSASNPALPLLISLLLILGGVCRAQDIRGYEIDRYEYFDQCTKNAAPPATARIHRLAIFVSGSADGMLLGGTLAHGAEHWQLTNSGSYLKMYAGLANAAPGGPYTFAVTTASQGVQRRTVTLPPASHIAPARIANLTDAQEIDATQPFTVRWDALKGLGQRDTLRFRVFDSEGRVAVENNLSKDETSVIIPAGALAPGTTNDGYVYVVHVAALQPALQTRPYYCAVEFRVTHFSVMTRPAGGWVEFPSNQLMAHETDGVINIPVYRSGSEGAVTVDYSTEDITARAGLNYVATNGTLRFPPGVTSQMITVPLLDDGQPTGPLSARVRLANVAGGGFLPTRPWLAWGILDGQAAPGRSVNAVVLSKVAFYSQTNDNLGGQSTRCVTSHFFVSVHPAFPGALSNAMFRPPRGSTRTLSMPWKTFLEYNEDFPTRALMDRTFPSGRYTVEMDTHTQDHLIESLRVTAPPRFAVPRLANWTNAQAVDSSAPFTLRWDPFPGATSNDVVGVGVRNLSGFVLIESPEFLEPGALPGAATSYDIPANTLQPDTRYWVNLMFGKTARCVVNAASGVKDCNIFYHTTGFHIQTRPDAGASPKRSVPTRADGESDCCNISTSANLAPEPPFANDLLRW